MVFSLLYLARFSIVFSLRIASENIARSDETDAAADTDLGLAIECCECDSDIPSPLQISSAVIKRIAYCRSITTGRVQTRRLQTWWHDWSLIKNSSSFFVIKTLWYKWEASHNRKVIVYFVPVLSVVCSSSSKWNFTHQQFKLRCRFRVKFSWYLADYLSQCLPQQEEDWWGILKDCSKTHPQVMILIYVTNVFTP